METYPKDCIHPHDVALPIKHADGDVSLISCLIERTAKKAIITTNWPELRRDTNIKEGDICLLLQKPGKAFHVGSYRSLLYLLHMLHRATVALLLDAVA